MPDLPREVDHNGTEPITELLRVITRLSPLLCKLGEPLAGANARHFVGAMQKFFYGSNLLTEDVNRDLRFAMDNLYRSLWSAGDAPYQDAKFRTAHHHFEKYRKQVGVGFELVPGDHGLWTDMQYLHADMMSIVEGTKGVPLGDLLLLRLAAASVEYGRRLEGVRKPKAYPELGASVHEPLRDYLAYALTVHLNVNLPDQLDDILMGDMRRHCLPGLREHEQEG